MSPRHLLFALLIVTLWGLNFVVVKLGLAQFPPFLYTAFRFLLVALLVVPFMPLTRQQLPWVLVMSATLGSLNFGLMFAGYAHVDAATGAILAQLGVPFSTILAVIFLKDRLGFWRICGLVTAFLGASVLAGEPQVPALLPVLLIVFSCLSWATSNLLMKRMPPMNALGLTGWTSFFAAPQVLLLSLVFEDNQWQAVTQADLAGWATIVYVAVAASIIAHSLWFHLIATYTMTTVVPLSLLAPVIGAGSAVLLLGEVLSWQKLVGGCLTISGVGIILWRQGRRGEVPAAPFEAEPVPDPDDPLHMPEKARPAEAIGKVRQP